MEFTGELSHSTEKQVEVCDRFLTSPERLKALQDTGLMDSPTEIAFDRLANLAARILKVPLTIVSFVSDKKQFFKAGHGLPAPYDVIREVPIDGSICRYTLQGEPIISNDASTDPLLKFHPATKPWGIGAFIALPIMTDDGHSIGAFCAVDSKARVWSEDDIEVMRELTASIMTEINLRSQIEKLKSERVMRETFVAALTHDLRTPLAASKLGAQLLIRSNPESGQVKKTAERITENIDRADYMIQDLLDVSQLNIGEKIPLDIVECNLIKLINRSLEDFKALYADRFDLIAEEDICGHWDESAIRRIVDNLASNAIKYGSKDSPIKIIVKKLENNVQIHIHNEGTPINEADQSHIFEPFHRSVSAAQGNQKGWGLGLALVRGLVEGHGGKISLESSLEKGTTFIITIPVDSRNISK
ncbi:GAF domain-containing sensor histidine kinase [Bacteriovorax sp. PP10]|uniref:histidine kinase n=1 Tax=Bacteriovorax antarcticus TaxID=3088717 RepID=A0ABU5VZH3_9BACT|nr:GAF domain-containing sensor histidine kinase [Bacteriovorax sp. PP10]MEA9356970.1 GAF domain-containing sensor histidine kinase [Bacteriovorax sp. PP10]